MLQKNKFLFYFIVLALAFTVFRLGTKISKPSPNSKALADGSVEKFEYLSKKNSNSCGSQPNDIEAYNDTERIQGSCCSPMDIHAYQEQVEGLKKYTNISQVPKDPYDIPVTLAKELFGYQKNIQLTPDQQKVYDEAMKMSHEGGPCCCKCWRWTAFEGQAKYLITKHNFGPEEIAEIWDLEDGCGGSGHEGHT